MAFDRCLWVVDLPLSAGEAVFSVPSVTLWDADELPDFVEIPREKVRRDQAGWERRREGRRLDGSSSEVRRRFRSAAGSSLVGRPSLRPRADWRLRLRRGGRGPTQRHHGGWHVWGTSLCDWWPTVSPINHGARQTCASGVRAERDSRGHQSGRRVARHSGDWTLLSSLYHQIESRHVYVLPLRATHLRSRVRREDETKESAAE
jgi:hypothetical protein